MKRNLIEELAEGSKSIEVQVINQFQTKGSSGGPQSILNVSFTEDVKLSSSAFDAGYEGSGGRPLKDMVLLIYIQTEALRKATLLINPKKLKTFQIESPRYPSGAFTYQLTYIKY